MKSYIIRYKFTTLCVIAIWILSLMPVPEVPQLEDIPLIDKWTHFVMYGGTMSMFFIEYWIEDKKNKIKNDYCKCNVKNKFLFFLIVAFCFTLMSGLLELLQRYCTGGMRSGEWLDLLANSIGVCMGFLGGNTIIKWVINIKK